LIINIIKDDDLLKINKEYLNKDYLTDVISFNYSTTRNEIEGDLYISNERVEENARLYGSNGFMEELNRIIIHGVLHLCGYEDNTKKKKKEMTEMENKYMDILVSRETLKK
jgi:probable rRNA maturation factor